MSSLAHLAVHRSQFPENVRRDLLESLRTRQVNHKFHYDSVKQTQKWLDLHQACSPSRTDPDCAAIYDQSFERAAALIKSDRVLVVGLGCGGGQKDTRLLRLLRNRGKNAFYLPSDVSTAMVLVARQTALSVIPPECCFPLVCDLASTDDLPSILDEQAVAQADRLVTFFGMVPNFEPEIILPRLAKLLHSTDYLLFSANLAPGPDYAAGMLRILPLYDNALTRDWLMTFLLDLGIESADGQLSFCIEDTTAGPGLKRVAAYFTFLRPQGIRLGMERIDFRAGDSLRLFFSYRHTAALVRALLAQHGLQVLDQWITKSEEEGAFLVALS